MKFMNKKMCMGIIAGMVLTVGGIGYAADTAQDAERRPAPHHRMGSRMEQHGHFEPGKVAEYMAKQFGLDEKEILEALNEKKDFRDIGHAAMLAKVSGKSFREVFSMKQDGKQWKDVEQSLGVTHEQIRETMDTMMAAHIAKAGKLDQAKVKELMKKGYSSRDILSAGKLADASGKDVQSVLDKKKINNRWRDVAKELGVDEKILRPAPGEQSWGGHGFGGPMGAPDGEPPQPPAEQG